MKSYKYFGENLKNVLKNADVCQVYLAKKSGLTTACISQIINGKRKPTIETVCKILDALEFTNFEYLVTKHR
jgi:predicted transcriptional regulator